MKEIFLFTSSTKTKVSKMVAVLTKSKTTHTALCLNGKFDNMYTFGRKTLKVFPAGLVHENIRTNVLHVQNRCYCQVFKLKVTDEEYQGILTEIEKYEKEKEKYEYALLGAWCCFFRKRKVFKYKRFCSQFVANLLSDGGKIKLPFPPELMRPKDFLKLENIENVYVGTINELAQKIDTNQISFTSENC